MSVSSISTTSSATDVATLPRVSTRRAADGDHDGDGPHRGGGPGGPGGPAAALRSKIEQALANAPAGSDANQVIKDTIVQALKDGPGANGGPGKAHGHHDHKGKGSQPPGADDSAFTATLQKYGVDAQQFQQDLQSAFEQVRGSGANPPPVPPGAAVDKTA